ncbi:MAG: hypothetical protein KJ077_44710 [Anaerolineae bacterium]|nr:hypothetical protein [Anaerolineae bacterium]
MMMQDQFTPSPEDQLEDALAMLAAGIPVADILAGAGDDADWLRPLLEVAAEVKELRPAIRVPSPEASLQRMLAYGQKLAANSPPPAQSNRSIFLGSLLGGGWLPRLAAGLVSALFIVVLLGGTLTVLAHRSLPGQPLYALKRAGETLRLNLTLNPDRRSQLLENFNQQRQTEAKLLLEQNQVAAVSFSGRLDSVTGSSLTVAGLEIQLTPQTEVSGVMAVGARVNVEALTQPPDRLSALAVTVVEPGPPTPLPSPTSTVTPTPSPTVTATPTPTATATRSLNREADTLQLPTFTPTSTPTDVPTNTPTVPPPPATATPLPASPLIPPTVSTDDGNTNENSNEGLNTNDNADGGNDNADDHGNDNGSDDSGSDNSGSGSDNSGSGGGDNSGSGGGGDDDSGSDRSGGEGGGGKSDDDK